jgi:hypothetical protein
MIANSRHETDNSGSRSEEMSQNQFFALRSRIVIVRGLIARTRQKECARHVSILPCNDTKSRFHRRHMSEHLVELENLMEF